MVTSTPEASEATGKATAYMPLPTQIDQCVNAELANRPTERNANGTVNRYLALDCAQRVDLSGNEAPIDVSVTISRMTGELTIRRRQDSNSQHDTTVHVRCSSIRARRRLGPRTGRGADRAHLASAPERVLSAANLVEVGIVMQARRGDDGARDLDLLLGKAES